MIKYYLMLIIFLGASSGSFLGIDIVNIQFSKAACMSFSDTASPT